MSRGRVPRATVAALAALSSGPRNARDVAREAGHESVSTQRRALEALEERGLVSASGGQWTLTQAGAEFLARESWRVAG